MATPTLSGRVTENRISDDSVETTWIIHGASEYAIARSTLITGTPSYYPVVNVLGQTNNLLRRRCEVVPLDEDNLWEGTVQYDADQGTPGLRTFELSTAGGQARMLYPRLRIGITGDQDQPEGIGADSEGNIEGTDVVIPILNFSLNDVFYQTVLTNAYIRNLFLLTGKVNNAPFYGFEAHEVLFLGATSRSRGDGLVDMQFNFAASPNVGPPGIVFGTLSPVQKDGWDVWTFVFKPRQIPPTGPARRIIKVLSAITTDRVYEQGNFELLGIGS